MRYDLTLLTATGGRPDALQLCIKWMNNQTFKGRVRWVIVNDVDVDEQYLDIREDWDKHIIIPNPLWVEGDNTQSRNLLAGLEVISPEERLVIIEDDDYYSPHFLEMMDGWLKEDDLVGERETYYYHITERAYRRCNNSEHASLCSTGMKGEALSLFKQICRLYFKFIDISLWKEFQGYKRLYKSHNVVGIKGLPGRLGIGQGHDIKRGSRSSIHNDDLEYTALKNLIGPDYIHYANRSPHVERFETKRVEDSRQNFAGTVGRGLR